MSSQFLLRDGYCLQRCQPCSAMAGHMGSVGMSASCPGKLGLLGLRERQDSPAPHFLPALTHKSG